MTVAPLLSVRDLAVHFPVRGRGVAKGTVVKAVDGVALDLAAGETLALVGESGCGKSTTAYAILGLERATRGTVTFEGRDISRAGPAERRAVAGAAQIVFQDPSAALNPKMKIGPSIAEPLAIRGTSGAEQRRRVAELLDLVGLPASHAGRYPNELSGGQRQRVVIARALALSPKLLICDEPVSALDVSIRSQILNLLVRLQDQLGLAYLFISHDLSVVRHIADRVAVMYLGTIVEQGDTDAVFAAPRHPYTEALLSAIPLPDPKAQRLRRKIILSGDLPSPLATPAGCPFVSRCPIRVEGCADARPVLRPAEGGTEAACFVRAG
ncbi:MULTISPECIES: ABC transporter ATP-binding protein [unclassified Inquilinus]|uniref:ABC transporter ATP-binding protein n=1 Tax=unclassified Inquilinus TaxID=2645927 RepID=UPI003F901284